MYFMPSGYREQLVSGEQKFAEIASTESDCNSSKKGGDLGPFGKGSMQSELVTMIANLIYVVYSYCLEPFEEAT